VSPFGTNLSKSVPGARVTQRTLAPPRLCIIRFRRQGASVAAGAPCSHIVEFATTLSSVKVKIKRKSVVTYEY
jgi:hypothetical protein